MKAAVWVVLAVAAVVACGDGTGPSSLGKFCAVTEDTRYLYTEGDSARVEYLPSSSIGGVCITFTGVDSGSYVIDGSWSALFRVVTPSIDTAVVYSFTFPHEGTWKIEGDALVILTSDRADWFVQAGHSRPTSNGGFATAFLFSNQFFTEQFTIPWRRA